jgi:hypothetical protein
MSDAKSPEVRGKGKLRGGNLATTPEGLPLELIERQFDRVQMLFPRIDSKINAVFAIVSAEIALASVALSGENLRRWDVFIPATLFICSIGAAVYDLYRCTFPHVKRGGKSLVYFAELALLSETAALRAFADTDAEEFRTDLVRQTWRTSIIAAQKFRHLQRATFSSLVSLVPWFWLLAVSTWAVKG